MTPDKIDYVIHEGMMVRQERHIKRLWILCIIIFSALVISNGAWLWYESQFEDQVITQDVYQETLTGGYNLYNGNVVGGDYGDTEN